MSKKEEAETKREEVTESVVADEDSSCGFCVYIGPTILGLVQKGTIIAGSREDAFKAYAHAIKLHPPIKDLIVSGDALVEKRREVRTYGTWLYKQYMRAAKE